VGKTLQFFVMLSVTGVALENLTDHIYNNRVPYVIVIKERLSWFLSLWQHRDIGLGFSSNFNHRDLCYCC